MKPTIMKFGGTSVEGATAFKNAARIVFDRQALRPVVVVSAMAGFTDALLGSLQQALTGGSAEGAAGSLEKHFDRHLRVIDVLLLKEASRMRELVDQSRAEIDGSYWEGRSKPKLAMIASGASFLKTRLLLMVNDCRQRCSPQC